ncbi:response regulator [candidate division KSB1 bacterium]
MRGALPTSAGFETVQAEDASKALDLLKTETVDLILMDVQLPGMNGLEATVHLKADPVTAAIPIVAVTSHAMKGEKEKALDAGCSGYLVKPIDVKTFATEVRKFIGP